MRIAERPEPPILFADQTPSIARLSVRRGGMKIVRRESDVLRGAIVGAPADPEAFG